MKPSYTTLSPSGRTSYFLKQGLLLLPVFIFYQLKAQLPAPVGQIINTSIQNWNAFYGSNVKAVSWTYEGVITTEIQRTEAVNEITDPAKAWMPVGDITTPSSVTAERVADDATITSAAIANWKSGINNQLKIGQHKVRIAWTKGQQAFTSLCITDNTVPVYDNMLTNIVLVDHHSVCFNYHIGHIWQSKFEDMTAGFITAEIIVNCDVNGKRISCDKKCTSSGLSFGATQITCQSVPIAGTECCQMSYAWAWATGFKSLKLKADKFGFEIEGHLGSSASGEGSCTECCTPTNGTPPARISVSSQCESDHVLINWETINNPSYTPFRKYTIESSPDGISWNTVGNVDAGFSTASTNNYSFKDISTGVKGNFYRVIAEQLTGSKTFSSLVASPCGVVQNISIWPNPAGSMAMVRIPSSEAAVIVLRLSNSQGVEVFRQQYNLHTGNNQFQLNMKNFAPGIYTLSAVSGGLKKFYKIIKAEN